MLVRQTWGNHYIDFLYDESGSPYSLVYDGVQYYYIKNVQGDVVQIRSSYGTLLVEYTYDAWGNVLSITGSNASVLGANNPIRYRSYYYDFETGFYYLNSRYYDPEIRRFINADGYVNANGGFIGYNMYAYCSNSPIVYKDSNGNFIDTIFDVISLGFSVAEVIANPADPLAWIGLVGDAVDLIPFVSGVGEAVRVVKIADNIIDAADTVHDVSKAVDNVGDVVDTVSDSTKALHRPYIRKSTREAVESVAEKAPDGRFLDFNTGLPIDGKYDLGHQYGHEFWRERDLAMRKGWSQKEFNDYMNDPSFYRIEDPRFNRSHRYEKKR